ncbi:hypothetical protein KCU73_g84, partial [Aureobasidium melanogenum]
MNGGLEPRGLLGFKSDGRRSLLLDGSTNRVYRAHRLSIMAYDAALGICFCLQALNNLGHGTLTVVSLNKRFMTIDNQGDLLKHCSLLFELRQYRRSDREQLEEASNPLTISFARSLVKFAQEQTTQTLRGFSKSDPRRIGDFGGRDDFLGESTIDDVVRNLGSAVELGDLIDDIQGGLYSGLFAIELVDSARDAGGALARSRLGIQTGSDGSFLLTQLGQGRNGKARRCACFNSVDNAHSVSLICACISHPNIRHPTLKLDLINQTLRQYKPIEFIGRKIRH